MKIRKIGWSSFLFSTNNISILTDPLALKDSGVSFSKCNADVALFTDSSLIGKEDVLVDKGLEKKVEPEHRDTVIEITGPGEFEIGGVMIRREINYPFYVIDEKTLRIVYMGLVDNKIDMSTVKDLGDVDVLILPIGNGDLFIDYDKIEKIINDIDPTMLIPCAFKEDGAKVGDNIKSREEFIKHFGFTNVRDESYVTVQPTVEQEQKNMEVIFLK